MFRITEDPSSGSLVQCLAKITKMVLSCPLTWTRSVLWKHIVTRCVRVCSSLYRSAFIYSELHTRTAGQNMLPLTPTTSMSTDTIEPFL